MGQPVTNTGELTFSGSPRASAKRGNADATSQTVRFDFSTVSNDIKLEELFKTPTKSMFYHLMLRHKTPVQNHETVERKGDDPLGDMFIRKRRPVAQPILVNE